MQKIISDDNFKAVKVGNWRHGSNGDFVIFKNDKPIALIKMWGNSGTAYVTDYSAFKQCGWFQWLKVKPIDVANINLDDYVAKHNLEARL